jgi:Trk-type K+ transport system membrane component
LVLAMVSFAAGRGGVYAGDRKIPPDVVWRATFILVAGLVLVGLTSWVILVVQDLSLNGVVFEVVSAFSTTGLLGITRVGSGEPCADHARHVLGPAGFGDDHARLARA